MAKDVNCDRQPRLNPSCPVCGEDEPEIGCLVNVGDGFIADEPPTFDRQKIEGLACICRRCRFRWHIEPLSKP